MRPLFTAALAGVVLAATAATAAVANSAQAGEQRRDDPVVAAFANTTRSTPWRDVQRIPLVFPTHHPQGFALVGDKIFMSTVEIIEAPVRYPEPVDGYDRTPGKGVAHVLVLDRQGRLVKDVTLGEDIIYHPVASTSTAPRCGCP